MTVQGETRYNDLVREISDDGRMSGRLAVCPPWEAEAAFCCL
jgi:hypothetical protein